MSDRLAFPVVTLVGRKPPERVNQGVISSLLSFILDFLFLHGRAVDHPEYPSVLQVLEIEDPVVANCLIDLRGIESILLFMVRSAHCIITFT